MKNLNEIWEKVCPFSKQHKDEYIRLLELIQKKGYKDVLEIGCYKGGTAVGFLELGLFVTSIDEWRQPEIEGILNKYPKFDFIESNSKTAEFFDMVDVLIIDGGHRYKDAEMDYYRYKDNVRKGGIIAFHDIHPFDGQNIYGCAEFYEDIKVQHVHEEIDAHPGENQWGGWGLLFV